MTNNIYISLLILIVLLTPFANVLYYGSSAEGVFGFTWMASFMFAIITPFSYTCFGLILLYFTEHLSKGLQNISRLLAHSCILIGVFYMIYTFYPISKDLPIEWYFILITVLSFVGSYLAVKTHNFILRTERSLKKIIARMFKYIYEDLEDKKLINPNKIEDFRKSRIELTEIIVDYEQVKP